MGENKQKRHSFCSMIRMILCFYIKIRIHDKKTEERFQVINKKMEERFHVIIGNMETTQTQLAEIRSRMAPVRIPPKPRSARRIWDRVVEFFLFLFQLFVFGLLLAWIACPVFLNFDAGGAVRITKPWAPAQKEVCDGQTKPEHKTSATAEATASVSINLSDGKCDVNIKKNEKPNPAVMNKPGSGNIAEGSSIKYINIFMAIVAYILVVIILSLFLRGLLKAGRRRRMLYECGGDFRKLLAASPDRAEHQKTFMREMMRVYFDKGVD